MPSWIVKVQNRNLNQQLHIFFSQFSLIILIMLRPTEMSIMHVLALARESMQQNSIAGRVGLTPATINRILQRLAVTGTLVPDKSTGAPRKTTPRQDCALLRMVQQDCFIGAWALMVQRSNLYRMRAGLKTNNNGSCPVVTVPMDPQGSPCWLPTTAVSTWSGHRGVRTWQWPIGSMSSLVTSPDSNFTW